MKIDLFNWNLRESDRAKEKGSFLTKIGTLIMCILGNFSVKVRSGFAIFIVQFKIQQEQNECNSTCVFLLSGQCMLKTIAKL